MPEPQPPTLDPRRIDGPGLRGLATWGSVYAPEWFKRAAPPLIAAATFTLVAERRRAAVENLERVYYASHACYSVDCIR